MNADREAMTLPDESVAKTEEILAGLAPSSRQFAVRTPLAGDECRWFNRAVDEGLVRFQECPETCFRRIKWGASGPDHFSTPAGAPRHIFSKPHADQPDLNREYIPHVAAYSYAVLGFGYDASRARFSFYRKYGRDLLTKHQGASYETDVEFFDGDGRLHLQIEAKKDAVQVHELAEQLDRADGLQDLPPGTLKEIEYVLDLAPRYLWVVGPGSIDPPRHVFEVAVNGLNATFRRVASLPGPPTA